MEEIKTHSETELEQQSDKLITTAGNTEKELESDYIQLAEEAAENGMPSEQLHTNLKSKAASLKQTSYKLRKAHMMVISMADELEARIHDIEYSNKRRKLVSAPPSNTVIDYNEKRIKNFAQGLNVYKLLLVCLIGSFAGVVVEMLWCLVTCGHIENRAGLVYGPFNLLYGIGSVALTLALYKFRNKGAWLSFLGGMVIGSIVEYVCSYWQEVFLGSRSWDYSHLPFNLNGRICLMYSIFWGILGVIWIKSIYPRMANLILKIPNKYGKIATIIITVFMIFNAVISCCAVSRWSQRIDGVEPMSAFSEFIDKRFPDERMQKIYVNMRF